MKVEVNKDEKQFTPVTFNITCESRDELLELWHRMNMTTSEVKTNARPCYKYPEISTHNIWHYINSELEKLK